MSESGAPSLDSPELIRFAQGTVRLRSPGESRKPRSSPPVARPLKYSKWRAAALASVYLLFGLHIAHWKLNGSTLAPLELNELMYTLEAGVVTAGFLLMATLILATAFVGRFFCSWACHIMALEDLCSWLLKKVRIRPKPVRSRLLMVVPTLTLLYMFVWPQIQRIYEGRPPPEIRILGDEDGWASFVTTDFWRNLPDPWIACLTFAVCGFAVIYFLGSRSFCLHACPYGAVFSFMDRFSPGRIKLTGNCEQCGICTGVCASGVRVHEEIAAFGKVVDANCMKDLDCVSACPQHALSYGFTRPAGFSSFSKTGRRKQAYDVSLVEELLMALVFLAVLFVFRGLYIVIPFLMTLGLAGIVAFLSVLCLRLAGRPDIRLAPFRLKSAGKLTRSGGVFVAAMLAFGLLFVHSAFIRYHEVLGQRNFDRVSAAVQQPGTPLPTAALSSAVNHLTAAREWGLFRPLTRDQQLASLLLKTDNPEAAEPYLRRIAVADPTDTDSRLALAQILLESGKADEAETAVRDVLDDLGGAANGATGLSSEIAGGYTMLATIQLQRGQLEQAIETYRNAAAGDPANVAARMTLGQLLADNGRYPEAVTAFGEATGLQPNLAVAHYNLAAALQASGDAEGAIEVYGRTLALAPDDVPTMVNLGLLLARTGNLPSAAEHLRRATEAQPDLAQAHFNLAAVLQQLGEDTQAVTHYSRAAELDPGYAEKVRRLRGE